MSISTNSDGELLDAIRKSDSAAFAELFKRYWKRVHAMTYSRVRSEEVTKEIVQDLFISLWDKRESLVIKNLPAYLYTAVKNRVLNYIESQVVRQKHWDYYKQFIPERENVTENDVELNELMEALEDGIDQLPEKSRTIFKLNRLEGHSVSEIANSLNLSEKAIQYHLTKSMKTIRLHMKDHLITVAILLSAFF